MSAGVVGGGKFFVIAGPCVIEGEEFTLRHARRVAEIAQKHGVQAVFKCSFDKANRTSGKSFRGPGLREGDHILQVDGIATRGRTLAQNVESIRGFSAGSVTLTVQRAGSTNKVLIAIASLLSRKPSHPFLKGPSSLPLYTETSLAHFLG